MCRSLLRILAWLTMSAATSPITAGPIQAIIDSTTGAAEVTGIMGEVFVAFVSPSELLRPEFRQNPPVITQIFPFPSMREQIVIVNPFNDPDGDTQLGEVFRTGLTLAELGEIEFMYQASFTTAIVRPSPTFVPTRAAIPDGQSGFYIIAVPEPATFGMLGWSLLGLSFRRPWVYC
jgi:hypothetical protein